MAPRVELHNVMIEFPVAEGRRSFRQEFVTRYVGGIIRGGKSKGSLVVRALEDIDLIAEEGDRIGIVGHNGSGKTTLLSVIAGIYEPVSGTARTRGRVSTLFNTTMGLDTDDTGIENIYNMSSYLGMSRAQADAKLEEIVTFSELGDYIDLPMRTYSTGMRMRLTFAIVTSIDPDILVLDEGLGAGDARFAGRAAERVNGLVGRSSVVFLASHAEGLITQICNKAILLEAGRIVSSGTVPEVLDAYHQTLTV